MRLFFLGTGAAEGYPGIFCNCDACNQARALGGRNIRLRSALLVNDDLLVDFGPDLLGAAQRHNRNLSGVRTGLVTHGHSDHLLSMNFEMRAATFTANLPIPTLDLFAPRSVTGQLEQSFPDLEELRLRIQPVHAFERWEHGGYTFQAFHAFHLIDQQEAAVFYKISDGSHTVLYATDTGSFPEDTWDALKGQSFDVIILEETLGSDESYSQHLGFKGFLAHIQRMRAEGMLRPGGRVFAHHFSHSGNPLYESLVALFAPHQVEVAYDGLEINLH